MEGKEILPSHHNSPDAVKLMTRPCPAMCKQGAGRASSPVAAATAGAWTWTWSPGSPGPEDLTRPLPGRTRTSSQFLRNLSSSWNNSCPRSFCCRRRTWPCRASSAAFFQARVPVGSFSYPGYLTGRTLSPASAARQSLATGEESE